MSVMELHFVTLSFKYPDGLRTHYSPGGGTPLQEANGDVPLNGVAFSRLE